VCFLSNAPSDTSELFALAAAAPLAIFAGCRLLAIGKTFWHTLLAPPDGGVGFGQAEAQIYN
jgi:hypothetical protein